MYAENSDQVKNNNLFSYQSKVGTTSNLNQPTDIMSYSSKRQTKTGHGMRPRRNIRGSLD